MPKAKPWLTISDGTLTDIAVARAEHHQRRLAKGSMDFDDKYELNRATFLLDHDRLLAFVRRKPLLAEITPDAFQAVLDAIKEAEKATPKMRRNRRTRASYIELAVDVWIELQQHPELSERRGMILAKANVAERRNFKTAAQLRKLKRACELLRRPRGPKTV